MKEKKYDLMLVNSEKELEESSCKESDLNNVLKEFINTNAKLLCIMNFEVTTNKGDRNWNKN